MNFLKVTYFLVALLSATNYCIVVVAFEHYRDSDNAAIGSPLAKTRGGTLVGNLRRLGMSSSDNSKDGSSDACPDKPDNVAQECYDAIMFPSFVCERSNFETIAEYIADARDEATRCCITDDNPDRSECRCPEKDDEEFLSKIDAWCAGVASC